MALFSFRSLRRGELKRRDVADDGNIDLRGRDVGGLPRLRLSDGTGWVWIDQPDKASLIDPRA